MMEFSSKRKCNEAVLSACRFFLFSFIFSFSLPQMLTFKVPVTVCTLTMSVLVQQFGSAVNRGQQVLKFHIK